MKKDSCPVSSRRSRKGAGNVHPPFGIDGIFEAARKITRNLTHLSPITTWEYSTNEERGVKVFHAFSKENFPGGAVGRFEGSFSRDAAREKAPEEAVSRVPCAAGDRPRGGHFSTTRVAARLERPGPEGLGRAALIPGRKEPPGKRPPIRPCSGWGLPCRGGRPPRGELLLTISPLPPAGRREAVCFSVALSSGSPHRVLPGTLPCGARTFLPPRSGAAAAWPPRALSAMLVDRQVRQKVGLPVLLAPYMQYTGRGTPATGGRPRRTAAEGAPTSPCISR